MASRCSRRNHDDTDTTTPATSATATHRVRVKLSSGRVIDETLCERHAHALYFGTLPLPQTISGSMTPLRAKGQSANLLP